MVFSGVGKTRAEMALSLEGGLFQFNLESLPEAETLSKVAVALGKTAPVAFRVNPDVEAGSHAKISTGRAQNKFGIPIEDALEAFARLERLPAIEIRGVAVHVGSQLTSLKPLEAAFAKLGALIATLREAGHPVVTADLGGGLGVAYDSSAQPPPTSVEYAAMVCRTTRAWDVRLIFEPGRLIVGNAGVLVTEVIRVKDGPSHPFVVLDAAMNDLLRPTLYDAWHGIEAVIPRGGSMRADVVGPVCETGDSFAQARTINRVEAGDLMIVRTAGAYAAAMASTYNSRPLTPEVLVNGDRWAVVRERQDVASIIEGEKIPPWLMQDPK